MSVSNLIERTCKGCGVIFELSPSRTMENGRERGFYHTRECYHAHRFLPPNFKCIICGREKRIKPSHLKRGRKCCSTACKNKFLTGQVRNRIPVEDRFWKYVRKTTKTGCWLWQGTLNEDGYGLISNGERNEGAHRVAWKLTHGPIPQGMQVLHNCPGGDQPACVNPAHLWLGNQADNMADCKRKNRNYKKLTRKQAVEIREKYSNGGVSQSQLADEYGVCQTNIWHIVNRKTWVDLRDI